MSSKLESILKLTLNGGSMSKIAIAVGCAERARTPDGSYTKAWWGHADPGNGVLNQGSFSYQGAAKTPKEADELQLKKLEGVLLPRFLKAFHEVDLPPERLVVLWALACDCYTQSEAACLGEKGFLDLIRFCGDGDTDEFINCRTQAYVDPVTDELDAPGFKNNSQRLYNDQKRRTLAILEVIA